MSILIDQAKNYAIQKHQEVGQLRKYTGGNRRSPQCSEMGVLKKLRTHHLH